MAGMLSLAVTDGTMSGVTQLGDVALIGHLADLGFEAWQVTVLGTRVTSSTHRSPSESNASTVVEHSAAVLYGHLADLGFEGLAGGRISSSQPSVRCT